jgi:hypothetical protein
MKTMELRTVFRISAFLICMLFAAVANCQDYYQVKLQNGRIIRVNNYYEKNGTIFLLRYGNYIGIEKSEVTGIVKMRDSADSSKPNQSKQTGSVTSSAKPPTAKSAKGGTTARFVKPNGERDSDEFETRGPTAEQQKSEEERAIQEERRQREAREQSLADMEANRLREIDELEQIISRLRDDRTQLCTAGDTPKTERPSMPAPKSAEEMAGHVNAAGNTVGHCNYLTGQIDEMEKKLQGLKDTDAATMLENQASKAGPPSRNRKSR